MDAFTVRSGAGAYVVEGRILILGDDLLVVLSGGERHIGAIGMQPVAQPGQTDSVLLSIQTRFWKRKSRLVRAPTGQMSTVLRL